MNAERPRLLGVKVANYRAIEGEISVAIPDGKNTVVIAGPNGSGKTSWTTAIWDALSNKAGGRGGGKAEGGAWHWLRGRWCGIPWRRIDLRFHLRRGATARCD